MADRILLKFAAMQGELTRYSWRAFTRMMRAVQLKEGKRFTFFYRSNPNLSFAPREINDLRFTEKKEGVEVDVSLNFMGLQGASTPLPIHFTETIIQDDPDDSNLNEFYNFFNQRIYSKLLGIEEKYAYLPQISGDGSDALTKKMASFAGFLGKNPNEKALLPFLNGMLGTNLAKGNWCRMIAGFIGAKQAWLKERVPTRIAIPSDHLGRLGTNTSLGETLSLGAYITQAKNHLELHLAIEYLEAFLPDRPLFATIQKLVRETMPDNMFVSIVFHAKKAKTASLSHKTPIGLGWSSMLGREQTESYAVKLCLI